MGAAYAAQDTVYPVLARWLREGSVTLPTKAKEPLPVSPVKSKPGTWRRLLDQDRGET